MEYLALAVGLAVPWLLGLAVLFALDWPRREAPAHGETALRAGFGFFIGALLLTLWMRALSATGLAFGWASIGLPLAILATALFAYAAWSRRFALGDARAAVIALVRPTLPRWQQLAWSLLVVWLALRFAVLAGEVAWRPLYPWDAWVQWATKARVWYELGHMVPFVGAEGWFTGASGAYYDASPHYPATVPLLQVWSCIALGRWDDSAMNWPWLLMLIALTFAIYGVLRGEGVSPLAALVGAYLVASLPLLDIHVALAGYADLLMACVYTLAALALQRWIARRDARDAGIAVFFALCCPLIKTPGVIWALTLLPAVVVAIFPRRGLRIVGSAFAVAALAVLALARTEPVILGYSLHLSFQPIWQPLAEAYFLFGNWNLLWYAAVALLVLGWRRLREPKLAPLGVVIAAGLAFLLVVFSLTNAAAWVADFTTVNRATLHLAPLLVAFGVLLWHDLTTNAALRPSARAVAPA